MYDKKDLINKEELIKSLTDLDFSEAEISEIVEKAEQDGKLAPADDKVVDKPDEYKEEKDEDKEEVKKAYDKIMSMKDELDKSMADFLDKYGKVPGFSKPTDVSTEKAEKIEIEKAEKDELEKAEKDSIEKAFGEKFSVIEKAFESRFDAQQLVNDQLLKSLAGIQETVQAIAETPNPYKGLFGSYGNAIIEKGGKDGEETVISLKDKSTATRTFEKAVKLLDNEADRQIVNNMISSYTISGLTNETGLNIVKKALKVDFEK